MSSTHQKSNPAPGPLQRLACVELRRATDAATPFQFPLQTHLVGTASPALRSRNSYQWRLCTFELAQLGPAVVWQTVSTPDTHLPALLAHVHGPLLSCLALPCLALSLFLLRLPAVPAAQPTGSAQTRRDTPYHLHPPPDARQRRDLRSLRSLLPSPPAASCTVASSFRCRRRPL
jgi:hypothetical protein